jgi:hypothetical protein
MKNAIVKGRRTDRLVGPMVFVVCPYCRRRHWLPAGATGHCPHRGDRPPFAITHR